jgi:hypothetical protein
VPLPANTVRIAIFNEIGVAKINGVSPSVFVNDGKLLETGTLTLPPPQPASKKITIKEDANLLNIFLGARSGLKN